MANSRAWWNRAAREDASWYIATASGPFLERGRRDTDEMVAFCGLQPSRDRTLLEIGAGAGRMTHRFVELYGRVIALDVSEEMLRLGWGNLTGVDNVEWVIGSGVDLDVIPDRPVDDVFSYITLQHVPSAVAVLGYLEDASRVLRQGGSLVGSTSHLEAFHSLSVWNYTPYGFSMLAEEAGLEVVELRPGIDGMTLVAWRALGMPRFFARWWARESPGNRLIELGSRAARLDARTRNQVKLTLCGQFAFLARRPATTAAA